MSLALEGLRVLDLSRLLPGPFATMVLADLGARVDKLEDTSGGDYLRRMPPAAGEMNASFHALNRGKRSLALDLKKPEGKAAMLDLVASYDVLVESFRPGVMDKLSLGYDVVSARHPKLVWCALSGYGATGPLAQRAGHDLNYSARAGILGLTGPAGAPPQVPGPQVADIGSALFAVIGILAALEERRKSGRGKLIDIALSESILPFGIYGLMNALTGNEWARGDNPLSGGIAPYNTYATQDGKHVSLAALEPKFWSAFCAGVGLEADMTALMPGPHQPELKANLASVFAKRSAEDWELFAAKHDCCLEVVREPGQLPADEQLAARQVFGRADKTGVTQPRTPVTPRETVLGPAPGQGEHTDEILREAGFDTARISALRAANVTL